MAVLPKPIVARIQWCENRIAPFTTNATAIGIDSTIAADFETKTEAARAALVARDAAEIALRDRNNDLRLAMIALTDAASGIINTVHAKANMVGNSVYSLASIPVPATPSPMAPPGTCSNFRVALLGDGSIELKWRANNPGGMSGVTYQVWRRIGSVGEFSFIGASGEKKYVDSTITGGPSQVQYQIRGIRPTAAGAWSQFNVNFGQTSSGAMMASVVETEVSPKLAA